VQDAVAADALVEDSEIVGLFVGQQAAGQLVGPSTIGILRDECAVGDAVAEGDDSCAVRGDLDVNSLDEGPGADFAGVIEGLRSNHIAGRSVTGLNSGAVLGELANGLRRKEETDGEVRLGREIQRGRVADRQSPRRDDDRGVSAEGEAGGGDEIDGAGALANGDVCRADGERLGAELVSEDDADHGAAERDMHDLAQGGVG
jgi:hypothetical protein